MENIYRGYLNESKKDDRNVVPKSKLTQFIDDNYFRGKVENISVGTSTTRYDITVPPKNIPYFLKLERQFNYFFNVNNCRLTQDRKYICLEIPNAYVGTYGMRDCFDALQKAERTNDELLIPIGEGLYGECILYDLVKMPHLLIAGQTGSGKSVFLHNLILSLIMQYSKDELNLILIDPKRVEFDFYRNVPCVRNVYTSTDRAEECITNLCDEMDYRYKIIAESGHRDFESYNKNSEAKMPRIVLIIEELADLVITSKDMAMKSISRLLNKARACGIHVIVSTQRPDSEFLGGKTKNNFQCRVVFSMASDRDSKVALGRKGAEKLRGNGDGIFRSNNGQENTRFQSPNVTEKEIKDVVKILTQKGE